VAPGPDSIGLGSGAVAPGGIPLAPGDLAGIPTQGMGAGGVPMAPGPAGNVSSTAFSPATPVAASGLRPGCSDLLGVGTTPNIMSAPGQIPIPSQLPASAGVPGC
jgi:hypothetical protein